MKVCLLMTHAQIIFSKAGITGSLVSPDIYKFIKSLKSEQGRGEMIRQAALIEEDMTAQRRKCDA